MRIRCCTSLSRTLKAASCALAMAIVLGLLLSPFFAQNSPARLELADKVRMVETGDGSPRPYFRAQFNLVDAQGTPVSIEPPPDALAAFEIAEPDGKVYRPLSLRYGEESVRNVPASGPSQHYALLLIDISGSMLESTDPNVFDQTGSSTKYDAAKTAARRFLEGFHTGRDHIAVVPFESHQVIDRIRNATFAGQAAEAHQQIDQLPLPQPNYNTALFSAVGAALDVLTEIKKRDSEAGVLLVVLTDGQNQILRGDDADLLKGKDGLEAVLAQVNQAGIQIMTIGFGDATLALGQRGALDTAALGQLAWPAASNFHTAQDIQSLGNLFGVARQLLVNRWRVLFTTGRDNRSELAGKDLSFQFRFRLPDRLVQSSWIAFKTPQMAAPPFEGKLDASERPISIGASSEVRKRGLSQTASGRALRRVLILGSGGALLLFLWFIVPMLLWPVASPSLPKPKSAVAKEPVIKPSQEAKPSPLWPSSSVETLLADRFPPQAKVEQTQIEIVPPRTFSAGAPDATFMDPRAQQILGLPADQTIMDPRGQQTVMSKAESSLTEKRVNLSTRTSEVEQTRIQIMTPRSAPDATMLDPRGQQITSPPLDQTIIDPRGLETLAPRSEFPAVKKTQVPSLPARGPEETMILNRPAALIPEVEQTRIQIVSPRSSPDATLLDPRGQQNLNSAPDQTIIDPRGQETEIRSLRDTSLFKKEPEK